MENIKVQQDYTKNKKTTNYKVKAINLERLSTPDSPMH